MQGLLLLIQIETAEKAEQQLKTLRATPYNSRLRVTYKKTPHNSICQYNGVRPSGGNYAVLLLP